MKTVTEPAAKYTLGYYGVRDVTIDAQHADLLHPSVLNNVVDTVRKYDPAGALLTSDIYTFNEDITNLDDETISAQTTIDHASGHTRQTRFIYHSYGLSSYEPILTPGRHTVLTETIETAGDIASGITETVSATSYRTAGDVPGWGGHGAYTVLPTSRVTTINGIAQSHQEFSYELDTLRTFWRTPELAARYGMEVTRKITRTLRPDAPSTTLLIDTTTYLHLPMPDTLLEYSPMTWKKLPTIANFFRLRDTLHHPDVVGKTLGRGDVTGIRSRSSSVTRLPGGTTSRRSSG